MLNYPLALSFKVLAFSPQVRVTDASGQLIAYVKQKALALRENVGIFADETQQTQLYQLNANKIIDFSAQYTITTPPGAVVGALRRQGARSLWKASYTIVDTAGNEAGLIHEENAWIKVLDGLVGEVPVVGMFTGLFLNPAYLVDLHGQTVLYLKKEPAMLEGKYTIERRGDFAEAEEGLLLSSIIMTVLLERSRG